MIFKNFVAQRKPKPNDKLKLISSLLALAAATLTGQAASISYTETWTPDTGRQADNDGDTFANYSEWEYFEFAAEGANARVDTAGELTLAGTGTAIAALVTPSDVGGSGAAFDVSTHPLVVSTTVGSRFGTPGSFNAGITIGDASFIFHPGFSGGAHRVNNRAQTVVHLSNTDMGFTPTMTPFTAMSISVIENGANYDFTYSIGSYNSSYSLAIATVGPLNDIGLTQGGGGDGNFGSFSVSQVPEPSAFALLGCGGLALILRRRK